MCIISWGQRGRVRQMWQKVSIWGVWVRAGRKLFIRFCNPFINPSLCPKVKNFRPVCGAWMTAVSRSVRRRGQEASQEAGDLDLGGGRDARKEGGTGSPVWREREEKDSRVLREDLGQNGWGGGEHFLRRETRIGGRGRCGGSQEEQELMESSVLLSCQLKSGLIQKQSVIDSF